jgi:hypothetical protein
MTDMAPSLRYDPVGSECLGGPQPGTLLLYEYLQEVFPTLRGWGVYNCRNVRGGTVKSAHAEGRAGDEGTVYVTPDGEAAAMWLVQNAAALGVQVVIWNRRIWSAEKPYWRTYTGTSPHTDHVHFENNWDGAKHLTRDIIDSLSGELSVADIDTVGVWLQDSRRYTDLSIEASEQQLREVIRKQTKKQADRVLYAIAGATAAITAAIAALG